MGAELPKHGMRDAIHNEESSFCASGTATPPVTVPKPDLLSANCARAVARWRGAERGVRGSLVVSASVSAGGRAGGALEGRRAGRVLRRSTAGALAVVEINVDGVSASRESGRARSRGSGVGDGGDEVVEWVLCLAENTKRPMAGRPYTRAKPPQHHPQPTRQHHRRRHCSAPALDALSRTPSGSRTAFSTLDTVDDLLVRKFPAPRIFNRHYHHDSERRQKHCNSRAKR